MKKGNNLTKNDKLVSQFLQEYSAKPADDGFTESVMEKIPRKKMNWGNILQYASCALAFIAIIVSVYVFWVNDILTAPKDLLGLSARLIKSSIYISLILVAIGIYAISNYSDKLGLDGD